MLILTHLFVVWALVDLSLQFGSYFFLFFKNFLLLFNYSCVPFLPMLHCTPAEPPSLPYLHPCFLFFNYLFTSPPFFLWLYFILFYFILFYFLCKPNIICFPSLTPLCLLHSLFYLWCKFSLFALLWCWTFVSAPPSILSKSFFFQ